ncbi:unnamed protein product [Boreogadus saida]
MSLGCNLNHNTPRWLKQFSGGIEKGIPSEGETAGRQTALRMQREQHIQRVERNSDGGATKAPPLLLVTSSTGNPNRPQPPGADSPAGADPGKSYELTINTPEGITLCFHHPGSSGNTRMSLKSRGEWWWGSSVPCVVHRGA